MRWLLIGAGCVLALAAAAPVSSALTGAPPCGPPDGHTLAVSSGARIYSLRGSVYGCAPRGRSVRLGSATVCIGAGRAGPAAATARLAAYGLEKCGVDTGSASVIVRRFSDGKVLCDQGALTVSAGVESYTSVGSIVVNRGGDVAWIAVSSSIVSSRRVIEVAERAGSEVRKLDIGGGIAPGSLRLRGAILTWRDGTATRSAKLG